MICSGIWVDFKINCRFYLRLFTIHCFLLILFKNQLDKLVQIVAFLLHYFTRLLCPYLCQVKLINTAIWILNFQKNN